MSYESSFTRGQQTGRYHRSLVCKRRAATKSRARDNMLWMTRSPLDESRRIVNKALILRLKPERIHGPPPQPDHDPDPGRCVPRPWRLLRLAGRLTGGPIEGTAHD